MISPRWGYVNYAHHKPRAVHGAIEHRTFGARCSFFVARFSVLNLPILLKASA
jgi:hypothetical protein